MMPLLRWTGNPVDMAVFSLMRGRQIFQQKESFPKPSLPPTALCPSVLCSWSCAAFPSSTQGKGWGNLPGKGKAAVHCSAEAGMKQRGSGQESHRLVSLPEFPIWSYHTYLESTREREQQGGEWKWGTLYPVPSQNWEVAARLPRAPTLCVAAPAQAMNWM